MKLTKNEVRALNDRAREMMAELREMGMDAGVFLISWQSENGQYEMMRYGQGNGWAQDGMLSDALDSNLVGTIATELGTYLGEEDDDADAWKDAG